MKRDLLAIILKVFVNTVELHSSVFWLSIPPITRVGLALGVKFFLL